MLSEDQYILKHGACCLLQETGEWPRQACNLAGEAVHDLCLTQAEPESHLPSKTANSAHVFVGTESVSKLLHAAAWDIFIATWCFQCVRQTASDSPDRCIYGQSSWSHPYMVSNMLSGALLWLHLQMRLQLCLTNSQVDQLLDQKLCPVLKQAKEQWTAAENETECEQR